MSSAAASPLEFRVYTGPQAGCRLPLKSGLYRAGSTDECDLLLADCPPHSVAFVIYLGQQEIAIEAVATPLEVEGRAARGLTPLRPEQIFVAGDTLYSIVTTDAAWPEAPQRPLALSDTPPEADTEVPSNLSNEHAAAPGDAAESLITPSTSDLGLGLSSDTAPTPAPTRPERRRPPFWALWLGATALFIVLGLSVLLFSLQPAPRPEQPDPAALTLALEQVLAAESGRAHLTLERVGEQRWRIRGHVISRAQLSELSRQLRAITPNLQLQLTADEDLLALSRDTLGRFADHAIELTALRFGELTLSGQVATAAQRDRISRTLFEDVPGLRTVHANISAADDALVALLELLAEAGLNDQIEGQQQGSRLLISGHLSPEQQDSWRALRHKLEQRFGPQLEIVENFHAIAPAQRSDIVMAIMGPVPYVVMSNGTKEGRLPADMPMNLP